MASGTLWLTFLFHQDIMLGSFFTLAVSSIVSAVVGIDANVHTPPAAQWEQPPVPVHQQDDAYGSQREWENVMNDGWPQAQDDMRMGGETWDDAWADDVDPMPSIPAQPRLDSQYGLNSGHQIRPSRRDLVNATEARQRLRSETRSNINQDAFERENFRFLRDRITQNQKAVRQSGSPKTTTDVVRARNAQSAVERSRQSSQQRYTLQRQNREHTEQGSLYKKHIERIAPDDHMWGRESSPVSMITYFDLECPHCKAFHSTLRQVIDIYDGHVNVVYRHFPLDMHAHAYTAALAAECAYAQGGDEGFWKFVEHTFVEGADAGAFIWYAKDLGMDHVRFNKCLENEEYAMRVQRDIDTGRSAGATGTPWTMIVNHETGMIETLPGSISFYDLQSILADLMQER